MGEVLVCTNIHIDGLVIQPGLSAWNRWLFHPLALSWMDRDEAEESRSHRQLIPYVVLRCGDKVFSYRRKGGEGRLDGRKSIGIGGHVEITDSTYERFTDAYPFAVLRELHEEVDVEVFATGGLFAKLAILRDDSSPVGRVHLGILHILDLTEPNVTPRETGITEAGFRTLDEIEADLGAYECWSVLALQYLKGGVR